MYGMALALIVVSLAQDPAQVLHRTQEMWLAELDAEDATEIPSQVIMALSEFGPAALDELSLRLDTPRPLVNSAALEALCWMGPRHPAEIEPVLRSLLVLNDRYLPTQAAQALAILGESAQGALPEMIALWDRPLHSVQRYALLHAIAAFEEARPLEVQDALKGALTHEDPWVRDTARQLIDGLDAKERDDLPLVSDAEDGRGLDLWFAAQLEQAGPEHGPPTPLRVAVDPNLTDGLEFFNRTSMNTFPSQSSALFFPPIVVARHDGVDLFVTWSTTAFRCAPIDRGFGMRSQQTYRGRVIVQVRFDDEGPRATIAAWRRDNQVAAWTRVPDLSGELVLQRASINGAANPAFLSVRSSNALADTGSLWMVARSRLIPNHRRSDGGP